MLYIQYNYNIYYFFPETGYFAILGEIFTIECPVSHTNGNKETLIGIVAIDLLNLEWKFV